MKSVLISVIVPVYNGERYLKRCIDSVCRQTFVDWELIVVDDGSTDGSAEVIRAVAAADSRVKPVFKENAGVVEARRSGVANSCGATLMFLDCDDYLSPDALSLLYKKMTEEQSDLVIAGYSLHWSHNGRVTKVLNRKPESSDSDDALSYCIRNGETFLPIKLFRRPLFERTVDIPRHISFMEDTVGILQYLSECKAVSYVNASIYYYYKHPESACHKLDERHWRSVASVYAFVCDYSKSHVGTKAYAALADLCINLAYSLSGYFDIDSYRQIANCLPKNRRSLKYLVCATRCDSPKLSRSLDAVYRGVSRAVVFAKKTIRKILSR